MDSDNACLERLLRAMRDHQRIDGSAAVLSDPGLALDPPTLKPYMPPFILARYQAPLADQEKIGDHLPVADFERLSLAARVALLKSDAFQHKRRDDADGAASHAAIRGLEGAAETLKLWPDAFPVIHSKDINEAVTRSAARIEVAGLSDESRVAIDGEDVALQRVRGGLQIVGCRIVCSAEDPAIRLANIKLPFSLRLIGCVIECPIYASSCDLVTLDLSGSALRALDATYLVADGSVRLRRTLVLSPVDFAGARIRGVFDASDCVITPQLDPPAGQAFDADRGMLNLAQASIGNDVLLERARIWGGISLRGAETARSIFMNDAVITAPSAILESWAANSGLLPNSAEPCGYADYAANLARLLLHNPALPADVGNPTPSDADAEAMIGIETLHGVVWDSRRLRGLLSQSMRARTSAVRADGITVKGSLFARGLKASGRVRLKYAKISGGFHLDRATLRSIASVGARLDTLAKPDANRPRDAEMVRMTIDKLRQETKFSAQIAEDGFNDDDSAIDIRDAAISGDFSLGGTDETARSEAESQAVESFNQTRILDEGENPALKRAFVEACLREFAPAKVAGVINLSGARIDGSAKFKRLEIAKAPKLVWQAHGSGRLPSGGTHGQSLDLSHCKVGDDVDFTDSDSIVGVNLEHAVVGGSIKFSNQSSDASTGWHPRTQRKGWSNWAGCTGRATRLGGRIDLRGAQVRGDVLLVFDPEQGPDIVAEMAQVDGRLEIYPAIGIRLRKKVSGPVGRRASSRDQSSFAAPGESLTDELATRERTAQLERPLPCDRFSAHWLAYDGVLLKSKLDRSDIDWFVRQKLTDEQWTRGPRGPIPFIDLRNARAAVFCHPPSAWPLCDGLNLAGFSYKRTSKLGPLAPHQSPQPAWEPPARFLCYCFCGFLLAAVAAWLFAYLNDWSIGQVVTALSGLIVVTIQNVGKANAALVGAISICAIGLFVRQQFRPRALTDTDRPMALEYLKLQRVTRTRAEPKKIYWPLDPYVVASKALREEGRYPSANKVDRERWKRRTSMLSFRSAFLQKSALVGVDWMSGFGYRLDKTVLVLISAIAIASSLSYWAMNANALVPAAQGRSPTSSPIASPPTLTAANCVAAYPVSGPLTQRHLNLGVLSVTYAADQLIPFLSVGEREHWCTTVPPEVERRLSTPSRFAFCKSWVVGLMLIWPLLLRALGLLITSFLAVALTARVESVLIRGEE